MTRATEIKNNSASDVDIKLVGGATVTLPPNGSIKDVDVDNVNELGENVHVKTNLTEVNNRSGRIQING